MNKTAKEILLSYPELESFFKEPEWNSMIAAMEEYASQSLPPVSEEEIFNYIKLKRDEILKPKGANMTTGQMTLGEITWINLCIDAVKHFHSQPVGKTDKLEVEQPEEKKEEPFMPLA